MVRRRQLKRSSLIRGQREKFGITLQYSYFGWLMYKTVKPLLYTVLRTKLKTVRKGTVGRRDEF